MKDDTRKGRLTLHSNSGKIIAVVKTDPLGRTFSTKTVDASLHFLRKPPAIAFDASTLEQAGRLRVEYHLVTDRATGRSWYAPHTAFASFGIRLNRGYGEQIALPLERWTLGTEPPPGAFTLTVYAAVPTKPTDEQGNLFAEAA